MSSNYTEVASPARVFTSHGTVMYVDATSRELRHGPKDACPSNVTIAREGEWARLRFVGADGQLDVVCLREHSAVLGAKSLQTNGPPTTTGTLFQYVSIVGEEFGLTERGQFLCAERDGRVTLSRTVCQDWERFRSRADANGGYSQMPFLTSWRIKHRQQFFAPLLPTGALCFDIGANHGEHTATFLSLGARRVVAVEPHPELAKFIADALRREVLNGSLIVRAQAVGSERGVAKLFPGPDLGKSMSTLSQDFISASGRKWDETATIAVNVVTLDSLIDEFGTPDYIKIDVEGFDLEVLRGLSRKPALLSFEFNTQPRLIDIAAQCIEQVEQLGRYVFNYQAEAPGETSLQFDKWVSAGVMLYTLRHDIARTKLFGDIFARRKNENDSGLSQASGVQ